MIPVARSLFAELDKEQRKRPITKAELAKVKARDQAQRALGGDSTPPHKQLLYRALLNRRDRRQIWRMITFLTAVTSAVVVALGGIALGIAFATTKTTPGRTVGLAAVILSSEVLLLMVPLSFWLVGLFFMDIAPPSATFFFMNLFGWPVVFGAAAAATMYAAVYLYLRNNSP